jgi:hypothetical protein
MRRVIQVQITPLMRLKVEILATSESNLSESGHSEYCLQLLMAAMSQKIDGSRSVRAFQVICNFGISLIGKCFRDRITKLLRRFPDQGESRNLPSFAKKKGEGIKFAVCDTLMTNNKKA